MQRTGIAAALCAAALLAACEAKIGADEEGNAAASAAPVSAEGKSEEGRFSIKAPGFDLKFDIPEGIAERAEVEDGDDLLHPGATLNGMHIEAGERGQQGGAVEIRFASADAPAKIAAWYREPGRGGDLAVSAVREEGGGFVVEGTQKDEGDPFKVTLEPGENGGTQGRLILSDRD